jgi:hypothetical protein
VSSRRPGSPGRSPRRRGARTSWTQRTSTRR